MIDLKVEDEKKEGPHRSDFLAEKYNRLILELADEPLDIREKLGVQGCFLALKDISITLAKIEEHMRGV